MPLFEVAVIQKPTKKEIEEGTATEKVILPITAVVAKDSQGAAIMAARNSSIPQDLDMSRVEVLVRPFG